MILTTKSKKQVGDVSKVYSNAAIGINYDPPKFMKVLRIATKQEYLDYWMANTPNFQEIIDTYGEPHDDGCYWEAGEIIQ